jgi:hypothetical protein
MTPHAHWVRLEGERAMGNDRDSWSGGVTLKEAAKMARSGWAGGWEHVAKMADSIDCEINTAHAMDVRHECRYDVAGDECDVGRFLSGEPENMAEWHETRVQATAAKFVQIEVGLVTSCSVSAADVQRLGATVCALVDLLERAGRRVRVIATFTLIAHKRKGRPLSALSVELKGYGDALDRDRAAMMCVHPAGSRQIIHCAIFRLWPQDLAQARMGGVVRFKVFPDTDIHVGAKSSGDGRGWWTSDDTARAWLIDQLREQGALV